MLRAPRHWLVLNQLYCPPFQIWLAERLKLVESPSNVDKYHCLMFCNRRFLDLPRSVNECMSLFSHGHHGAPLTIRWVVEWWRLKEMMGVNEAFPFLQLVGLNQFTHVFPSRLMRQYGLRQSIPLYGTPVPPSISFTSSNLSMWERYFMVRPRWQIPKVCESTHLRPSYKKWLLAKSKEEVDSARRLECRELGIPLPVEPRGKAQKGSATKEAPKEFERDPVAKKRPSSSHAKERMSQNKKAAPAPAPQRKLRIEEPSEIPVKQAVPAGKGKQITQEWVAKPRTPRKKRPEGTSTEAGSSQGAEMDMSTVKQVEAISIEEIVKDPPKEAAQPMDEDTDPKHARKDNA